MLSRESVRLVSVDELDDYETITVAYGDDAVSSTSETEDYVDCHDHFVDDEEEIIMQNSMEHSGSSTSPGSSAAPSLSPTQASLSNSAGPPPVAPLLNHGVAKAISSGTPSRLCASPQVFLSPLQN